MSKRRYRSTDFQAVEWARVRAQVAGARVAFCVDVAKELMVAVVMTEAPEAVVTLRWQHPQQTRAVVERLQALAGQAAELVVVLEPSGTYGDALCGLVRAAGLEVYRVSPKRVHDAAEVFDGVPSLHDAKAAYLIGRLHFQGVSQGWVAPSAQRRELTARLSELERYKARHRADCNRLEGQLARHWPESVGCLELESVSLLQLLAEYGEPARVVADEAGARALLRRCGRAGLKAAKIEALLAGARTTVGLACVAAERELIQALAREVLASQRQVRALERVIQGLVGSDPALARVGAVVGRVTAAVLWAGLGDPRAYPYAHSLLKAGGLNLKVRSSGKHEGQVKITKRGPAVVRFYLYYAALRLLARDGRVQGWYQAKLARPGALAGKVVVALMRKLLLGLWHVAQGAVFDVARLLELRVVAGAGSVPPARDRGPAPVRGGPAPEERVGQRRRRGVAGPPPGGPGGLVWVR